VQSLLGINYQLGARRRSPGAGQPRAAQPAALEAIREEVLGVVAQLRALIGDLRPPGLEEFGLSAALEGYVAQLRREGSPALPAITLDLDPGPLGLPTAAALDLFRNAQEALRNALRHSQARQVTVSLHRGEGTVVLEVRADGRGFDVPPRLSDFARSSHFGLIGMAERVELAGGQLAIHSQPGQGTAVTAWLPVPGEGGGDE